LAQQGENPDNLSSLTICTDRPVYCSSVRAGIFDQTGRLLQNATHEIKIWNPKGTKGDFYQQSSDDIWESCCKVIKVNLFELYVHVLVSSFNLKI
jgi:ribulose kinase